VPIKPPPHPTVAEIDLVRVLSAIGDPIRLSIVRTLSDSGGERAWSDLDVPIAQSTLSHHLKVLRTAGVIQSRQEGTRCFVSLRKRDLNRRFPGLLSSILRAD
jgi:DNA-binding transcriptional ArsR family regulator